MIAAWKLVKAVVLLAVSIGLLRMVHRDLNEWAEGMVAFFRADPDNHYIHLFLSRVSGIDPRQLRTLGVGSFFYSTLLFVEGFGLWFEKTWAEYLTVFATGSLVPVELYELWLHPSRNKVIVLVINLAILWYLIWFLRGKKRAERERKQL